MQWTATWNHKKGHEMKITNTNANLLNKAYPANQATEKLPSKTPGGSRAGGEVTDSVNISSSTREMHKIQSAMDAQPEERAAKVARLKESVTQGLYNVNPGKVAGAMTAHLLDGFA